MSFGHGIAVQKFFVPGCGRHVRMTAHAVTEPCSKAGSGYRQDRLAIHASAQVARAGKNTRRSMSASATVSATHIHHTNAEGSKLRPAKGAIPEPVGSARVVPSIVPTTAMVISATLTV